MCYRIAVCLFFYFVSSLLLIVCLYNALECLALYCTGLGGGGGGVFSVCPLLHVLLWDWCLVGLGMYLFAGCWFILSVSIIECALFARLPHNIHILYIRVSQI